MSRRACLAVAVAACLLLMGNINVTHVSGVRFDPTPSEVRYGALAPGSEAGANATNATASVTGTLLSTTTDVLYLNNTNATGIAYARLAAVSTANLTNLVDLQIGIDNGTRTDQITGSLGALTVSNGTLVRLAPGSTNRIYVTQSVTTLGVQTSVPFLAIIADDPAEKAKVTLKGRIRVI